MAEAQQHKHKGPGGARNKGGRKLVKQTSNPGDPRKKSAASSLAAHEAALSAREEAQQDFVKDPDTGKWVPKEQHVHADRQHPDQQ